MFQKNQEIMPSLCMDGLFDLFSGSLESGVRKTSLAAHYSIYLLICHHVYVQGLFWKRKQLVLRENP